jgi:thiosulfate reductase cytochrome b subunit
MNEKLYLYPLWVRLWHVVNILLFLVLICTGLCLQYSSTAFTLIPFYYSVTIHNIAGIILTAVYVFFLFANRFTSNGNYYQIKLPGLFRRLLVQFRYYTYGVFKKEEPPYPVTKENKFNPMQQLSYVLVMYFLMPVMMLTGIMLFFPDLIPPKIMGVSGLHLVDLLHITSGFALSVFLVIHIYFCTLGETPMANFKSIVTGWHGG